MSHAYDEIQMFLLLLQVSYLAVCCHSKSPELASVLFVFRNSAELFDAIAHLLAFFATAGGDYSSVRAWLEG